MWRLQLFTLFDCYLATHCNAQSTSAVASAAAAAAVTLTLKIAARQLNFKPKGTNAHVVFVRVNPEKNSDNCTWAVKTPELNTFSGSVYVSSTTFLLRL